MRFLTLRLGPVNIKPELKRSASQPLSRAQMDNLSVACQYPIQTGGKRFRPLLVMQPWQETQSSAIKPYFHKRITVHKL